jgi:hypothetical protein
MATSSGAAVNLVANGGFEITTLTSPGFVSGALPGWTPGSFDYLWFPGTADQPGLSAVWGPGTSVNNGLPATSPAGGNFLEQDPYFNSPLTQTITGLTPSGVYQLSFYWAAPTWTGALLAPTTRDWQVSLGAQSFMTPSVTVPAQGFQGWMHETFTFTPSSSSELLSFLSQGVGDPPIAFLDGVTLEAVPEPGAWVMVISGIALAGAGARRSRSRSLAGATVRA